MGVFALALAYLLIFVGYGINLEDEGTLLYQFERMAEGQRPYEDFHAGYTPGVYLVHSFLQGAFEQSILPGRYALAVVNATSAALVATVAYPLVGGAVAALAGLLYVALLQVHPGYFAVFNVPYPTWYSVAIFVLGLLPARRFLQTGISQWAFAAGVLAGFGFLFKPNVGAFQLACAMLLVLSGLPRELAAAGGRAGVSWWWAVWASVVFGIVAVFGIPPAARELVTLILPALVCALVTVRLAGEVAADRARSPFAPTLLVLGGFALVTAAWLAPIALRLPLALVLERVLFVSSDFADPFYRPHPYALGGALVLSLAYVAASASSTFVTARVRGSTLAIAALAAVALGIALVFSRPMVQGLAFSVQSAFEETWAYTVALAVHWLLLAALWRRADSPALLAPLTFGACFLYLQIYPRTDFTHWMWAAPLTLAGTLYLVQKLAVAWTPSECMLARRLLFVGIVAPILVLALLRLDGATSAVFERDGASPLRRASVQLANPRAPVWMNIGKAGRYRELRKLVSMLHVLTMHGERVFTFPALDAVSFLSDRHSPLRDSYFFPRWLGHDDERAAVATLERDPPRYAVLLRETWPFFKESPAYYQALRAFFEHDYRVYLELAHFAVLVRRDAAVPPPAAPEAPPGATDLALVDHIRTRLAAADGAAKPAIVERLAGDLIEGHYVDLEALLQDDDVRVRSATVHALRNAGNDRSARALALVALGGKLEERDRAFALRLAGAWAGPETVGLLAPLRESDDALLRAAALAAAGTYERRRELESFWWLYDAD